MVSTGEEIQSNKPQAIAQVRLSFFIHMGFLKDTNTHYWTSTSFTFLKTTGQSVVIKKYSTAAAQWTRPELAGTDPVPQVLLGALDPYLLLYPCSIMNHY